MKHEDQKEATEINNNVMITTKSKENHNKKEPIVDPEVLLDLYSQVAEG